MTLDPNQADGTTLGYTIFLQLQARDNPDTAASKLSKVNILYSPALSRGGDGCILDSSSRSVCNTVKYVLIDPTKIYKTKVLMANGSLIKVESIAECSPLLGAFCNNFDIH